MTVAVCHYIPLFLDLPIINIIITTPATILVLVFMFLFKGY